RVLLHCDVCCLVVFLMIRPPPSAPLSPYPTLFRSHEPGIEVPQVDGVDLGAVDSRLLECLATRRYDQVFEGQGVEPAELGVAARSEEHTSELQSRENLVCRLLLEKKKNTRPVREAI